ncbi:penicillin-binding protein 2 [soil metagenome]
MAGDKRATRLGVLAVVAVLLLSAIGVRLWFLQTVQSAALQEQVDATSTRVVRLPPVRGQIIDADGRLLAGNEAMLTVVVEWDVIKGSADRATLFQRLSGWVQVSVEDMEARYDSDTYNRLRPLPLAEDVPEDKVNAIMERSEDFPGVSYEVTYRRTYPYAPLASQVVGYMGAITGEDQAFYDNLGYDTSNVGERVGRGGVELSYEQDLHGQWGERVVRIDTRGRVVEEVSFTPPVNGVDIQLSIDLDLQQYAESLLQTQPRQQRLFTAPNPIVDKPNGTRQRMDLSSGPSVFYPAPAGSVVVMNHQTGQIMAMASYPTFDNRWFSQPLSKVRFDELFTRLRTDGTPDPDQSVFVNRAIQGQYNLGSTFKPFVAYAGFVTGLLDPSFWFSDTGTYTARSLANDDRCISGLIKCVWRNSTCGNGRPCVYGSINTFWALAVSSDAFFYHLCEEFYLASRTLLQDVLRTIGFGVDTGVDLPSEFEGRVPDDALKARLVEADVLAEGEQPNLLLGDEINMAIGQGLLAASPMQVAVAYVALANGGYVLTPRVAQAIWPPNTPVREPGVVDFTGRQPVSVFTAEGTRVDMPPAVGDQIVGGLRQNVTGPGINGRTTTAEELFAVGYPDSAIPVAGKTGTAQGRISYPWNDSSVFAAFSLDADRPFTVVTYLEKAGFGSRGAAPVVKCMFLALSGVTVLAPVAISEPLDLEDGRVARPAPAISSDCMRSSDPNTVTPGPAVSGRPND